MIHGAKKVKKVKTEQESKEEDELSEKINNKLSEFFSIPRKHLNVPKIPLYFEFTSLLMQLTSDIPTIFNFRRELILRDIQSKSQQQKKKIFGGQIKLTTKLIQSDSKSYTIWSYRQWLVKSLFEFHAAVITAEKELIKMLLLKDEKNFHVWNYRNWLNSIQAFVDEDLTFTEQKIKSNPFNFSPYHFRTKFLHQKYEQVMVESQEEMRKETVTFGMPKSVLQQQFVRVKTAIFLNPNEEAPWTFYNWLLSQLIPAIVVHKEKIDNKWKIYLNMKVNNFTNLIIAQNNKILKSSSGKQMNDTWQVQTQETPTFQSNLKWDEKIQLQSNSRLFLGDSLDPEWMNSNIKSIFNRQIAFIDEVIESQESLCRFAYLQKSYICKFILQCGTSESQFNRITELGHSCLDKIKDETKAHKFIQKQLQYWLRITKNELSKTESSLKTLYG